jgi:transcription-repair coupling factor (superfamily II helicase)
MPEQKGAGRLGGLGLFADVPGARHVYIHGADSAYRILYAVHQYRAGLQVFFVAKGEYEAKKAYESLRRHLPGDERVCLYPREQMYFTHMDSFSRESAVLRLKASRLAQKGEGCLIVASIWALCEKRPFPRGAEPVAFRVGEEIDRSSAISRLVEAGYEREERCEAAGQFAVRGAILDVFAGSEALPARIELFGDGIESIRTFDPATQLSVERIPSYSVYPFSDALLAPEEREKALSGLAEEARRQLQKLPEEKRGEAEANFSAYLEMLSLEPEQAGRLAFMYSGRQALSLIELFSDPFFVLSETAALSEGYKNMQRSVAYDFSVLQQEGRAFPAQLEAFYSYREAMALISRFRLALMSQLKAPPKDIAWEEEYNAASLELSDWQNNASAFFSLIPNYVSAGYSIAALYSGESEREPLRGIFEAYGYQCGEFGPGRIALIEGFAEKCLDLAKKKILLVPHSALYKKERARKAPKAAQKRKESFADIRPGDYVVHDLYGIGRYEGVSRLSLDGASRDYIRIAYAKEDVLYIPTEQMYMVEKYVGSEDAAPKLSRLGTSEWSAAKQKARGAAKELAQEYIRMYAERTQIPGFAFGLDTPWQKDFEDRFAYEPTEDQIKCAQEAKADMERPVPMDRLLLGDVGYGKTEVALRAAFKAVMEGKQAAVLVPTTILALQHFNTFSERFAGFPVKIDMISRLRSAKQKAQSLKDLASGSTDIAIGTHALIADSVKFRDLGLLIVDEEQRFGVAHKDRLKLMKRNVDTLTLSATPIPRTLHMSLIGVKDMSVIETPPHNRLPVQTYVMPYDEIAVKEAILNELSRGGQVFYLHNRIRSIGECAARISRMAPGARVIVAHAKMAAAELESAVLAFLRNDGDVLVSTSIIENGVDFVNANTIVIENADLLGLSQLYQLRGRVGRGERQAYAYMTYRKEKALSEDASKRLEAIREFTKFGSGFKVAMRDLEIRGAGSLLGSRQHGHFSHVGYELYTRMLAEAVAEEFPDSPLSAPPEPEETCEIDIRIDAYLPDDYIDAEAERVEIYKKIAAISDGEGKRAVEEELLDRFSALPEPVSNLLSIALVREKAAKAKVRKIKGQAGTISLSIEEDAEAAVALLKACQPYSPQLKSPQQQSPYILLATGKEEAIRVLLSIFAD